MASLEHVQEADNRRHEFWRVGPELRVMIASGGPEHLVAYLNLSDRDPFFALYDLQVLGSLRSRGVTADTPHSQGHNCFRFPTEQVREFLAVLEDFFIANRESVLSAVQDDERAKDWRTSWWYEYDRTYD